MVCWAAGLGFSVDLRAAKAPQILYLTPSRRESVFLGLKMRVNDQNTSLLIPNSAGHLQALALGTISVGGEWTAATL